MRLPVAANADALCLHGRRRCRPARACPDAVGARQRPLRPQHMLQPEQIPSPHTAAPTQRASVVSKSWCAPPHPAESQAQPRGGLGFVPKAAAVPKACVLFQKEGSYMLGGLYACVPSALALSGREKGHKTLRIIGTSNRPSPQMAESLALEVPFSKCSLTRLAKCRLMIEQVALKLFGEDLLYSSGTRYLRPAQHLNSARPFSHKGLLSQVLVLPNLNYCQLRQRHGKYSPARHH